MLSNHRKPQQERSRKTYDQLLEAAETLLEEVGVERISTNLIAQRAKLTAPAFYRYFDDKYAVIEALAERLMQRQNVALEAWIARYRDTDYATLVDRVDELVRDMDSITRQQPGAVWIIRALRAVPRLAHIRLQSHNYVAELLTDLYMRYLPDTPRALVRRRTRIAIEIAYSIDEMLKEETLARDEVFADLHYIFHALFHHPDLQPLQRPATTTTPFPAEASPPVS